MSSQVRIYTIEEARMSEFVELWRSKVLPLRRSFGFEVDGAWVIADNNQFMWIISHAGDFAAADSAYYRSPERAAMDPSPAELIDAQNVRMALPVAEVLPA